ncbi:MAG: hypothetical protein ACI4RT_08470 [Candidatus Spyradenecus sp.]
MITIDTLRAVAANRTLTLNAAGNEMIENKRFQKFRSFFNIGSARAENQQTLDAVRTAIQNDPRFASLGDSGNRTLDRLLGAIRTDRAISARNIRSVLDQMEEMFNDPIYQRRGMYLRIDARIAANPRPAALRVFTDEQYAEIAHNTLDGSAIDHNFAAVDIPARLADLNTQLEHLLNEIGDDAELRRIFLANTHRIFEHVSVNDLFDSVLPKLQGFRAVLAAAPQGNTPADTATYRRLTADLLSLIGKPIDPRHIAVLNNFAAGMPLPAIAALGPNATPNDLFLAINDFIAAQQNTPLNLPDGLRALDGGDEIWPARVFIAAMATMRLPEADRAALFTLLTSPAATQVNNLYNSIDHNDAYMSHSLVMSILLQGVASAENHPLPTYARQPVDFSAFSPMTLTRLSPLDGCFTGNAVGPMRRLLKHIPTCIDNPTKLNLETEDDPGAAFQRAITPAAKSMIAFNAASEMKTALNGDLTTFEKDIRRQLHVRLPDGTMLPNNYAEALDKLTALLSGAPEARFETAPVALRNRVHLVTTLLSQETEKVVDDGIPTALNAKDTCSAYTFALRPGTRTFALALNPDGGITVTYDRNLPIAVVVGLGNEDIIAEEGSFQAAHLSITLTGEDMDHFLAANWAEGDFAAASDRLSHLQAPGDLGNVLYAIPASYRLNPQVEVGYHIHINA